MNTKPVEVSDDERKKLLDAHLLVLGLYSGGAEIPRKPIQPEPGPSNVIEMRTA